MQPIRLILPDLFQDRLTKLTEHAAHVDIGQAAAFLGLRSDKSAREVRREANESH